MMHDIVKDYVDDLLTKSPTREGYWDVVRRVFCHLFKHNVRLNIKKCEFGVTFDKLLCFIMSKQGIKIDPKKIKTITDMPPPHDLKTLRSLQGKMQTIYYFVS